MMAAIISAAPEAVAEGAPSRSSDDGSEKAPWYKQCLVGMEIGPTGAQSGVDPGDTAYAERFSGKDIVDRAVGAGSEYVVIWAKDSEFAYYDSKVAPKCPGLGKRDVLREAVDAGREHHVPIIAYCVVQGNGYPLRDHPEYKMQDAAGKPIDRICFNSGYMEHAKAVVAEMVAYGLDGLHIDMLDQGFGPPYGCWCPACRKLFQETYGAPMPAGVTWDEAWDRMMSFRFDTSARFERELREYIRSIAPNVSVDFNYHGYPPFSWEVGQRPVQHAHIGDFVTSETGVWGFSALAASLTAGFVAATGPGETYQVVIQRGVRSYHDMTTRPTADMRWEVMTLLSHGAQVTIVDKTPYDGALDRVTYERVREVFDEAHRKREHFGQPLLPEAGIYYSSRSRDWYGRETPTKYQQSFNGAHKALVYEHIPFGVILDENVSLEELRRYPVVYLPNAVILSENEVKLFTQYVSEGGRLLVTGLTGLFDAMGRPKTESALADLIGGRCVRVLDSLDNHVRLADTDDSLAPLHRDIPLDWPFMVHGPAAVFTPTTAVPVGELMQPHRTLRQQKGSEGTDFPNSADKPVGPAFLVNTYGKGKVVYLPSSPDAAIAGEYGMVEDRRIIRNAIRFLNPEPEIEIAAPLNVEAVVTDDAGKRMIRVHLIGYLSPPASTPSKNRPYLIPSLMEEPLTYTARIRLRRPIVQARPLNPSTDLTIDGPLIEVTVRDVHEAVLISY